jgi:hypothetical protein
MTQQVIAATDLQEFFRISAVAELRAIELERTHHQLILRGVVCSYYYKQLAQELVRTGAGGLEIENQILVEYDKADDSLDWRE